MKKIYFSLVFFLVLSPAIAQTFEAGLQLRPRFEYRNGYKTLLTEDQDAAAFISQRSRLSLGYQEEKLLTRLSVQNISVWGDVPTMTLKSNNGVAVFEAFGQYQFNPSFMMRLGRQVLSYDNQRILGEVNWAQQGQSHDAALISWLPAVNHQLDVAVAYNSPGETLTDVPYTLGTYKNLQLAWYHIETGKVGFSFLLMNTGYEYDGPEEREVDYLQTYGAFHRFGRGKFSGDIAAYGQSGKRNDMEVSAWYGGLNLNYALTSSWKLGVGAEYLSGTDMDEPGKSKSFTPLFGTNHGFNGHMDYFYVGNHQNTVGLMDFYGKLLYTTPKFDFSVMPHFFSSAADVKRPDGSSGGDPESYLGTEIDLAGTYKIQKDLSVAFGYSQMFGTESLEILKGGDSGETQNWAWIMVNFSPKLFSFTKEKTN